MANEIAVIEKNWLALADQVKDHRFIGLVAAQKDVVVGTALVLRREPLNERDELAILVETAAGEKIGYVPRKHNPILARLMDAGKQLAAKVVRKELEEHWLNIRIAIDMKEV